MGVSLKTTLNVADDRLIAAVKLSYCCLPKNVRVASSRAARHCGRTGWRSEGTASASRLRLGVGTVGARSGSPVCALSQVWLADALALRNDRSSRKKASRFLPQRKDRYSPLLPMRTGAYSRKAWTPAL